MRRGASGQRNRKNSAPCKRRQLWVILVVGRCGLLQHGDGRIFGSLGKASASSEMKLHCLVTTMMA